jgi:hypothetical protein
LRAIHADAGPRPPTGATRKKSKRKGSNDKAWGKTHINPVRLDVCSMKAVAKSGVSRLSKGTVAKPATMTPARKMRSQ